MTIWEYTDNYWKAKQHNRSYHMDYIQFYEMKMLEMETDDIIWFGMWKFVFSVKQ